MHAANINHPSFAKGFDLPAALLVATAVFVSPKLALVAGLLAGLVCDSYADRLYLFYTLYYAVPGAVVAVFGKGLLAQSNYFAAATVFLLITGKFIAQYIWLISLGHLYWPTVLLELNWWGPFLILILLIAFWKKTGEWLTGKAGTAKFGRGVYGR